MWIQLFWVKGRRSWGQGLHDLSFDIPKYGTSISWLSTNMVWKITLISQSSLRGVATIYHKSNKGTGKFLDAVLFCNMHVRPIASIMVHCIFIPTQLAWPYPYPPPPQKKKKKKKKSLDFAVSSNTSSKLGQRESVYIGCNIITQGPGQTICASDNNSHVFDTPQSNF